MGTVRLGRNQYGKAETRLFHVDRASPRHRIRDLNVSSSLRGRFEVAHTVGDQSQVLTTDTQKNTVFAFAREHGIGAIEDFAALLAEHFVDTAEAADGAVVHVVEYGWDRMPVGGGSHDHAFLKGSRAGRFAEVDVSGAGTDRRVIVTSGVRELVLLKTTGSAFKNFLTDRYTTLAPVDERILATSLEARWVHQEAPGDGWDSTFDSVVAGMLDRFAELDSLALQQTLYAMGAEVLEKHDSIDRIDLVAPNVHHNLVDLGPFGLDNLNEVFHVADRPYGLIEVGVVRDDDV